jgi:hypothetical protein
MLAGFLAILILSLGTDTVLHAAGVFPPWGQPMVDELFLLAVLDQVEAVSSPPSEAYRALQPLGSVPFLEAEGGAAINESSGPAGSYLPMVVTMP